MTASGICGHDCLQVRRSPIDSSDLGAGVVHYVIPRGGGIALHVHLRWAPHVQFASRELKLREHHLKLYKKPCHLNVRKYFFSQRIISLSNSLTNSSAVTDKSAQRAASRQTAKFYNNSSGDEIANVNFLRRYGMYVLQNTKKENLLRLTN